MCCVSSWDLVAKWVKTLRCDAKRRVEDVVSRQREIRDAGLRVGFLLAVDVSAILRVLWPDDVDNRDRA